METARFVPLEGFRPYPEEEMIRRAERFAGDMGRRRTVRQFSTRTVPRQVIERCLDAAASAPSGANMQPWHFVIVSEPAIKRRIRTAAENEERAFYSGRAPRDWLDALAPLGTDDHKPYLEAAPYLVVVFGQPYHLDVDGRYRNRSPYNRHPSRRSRVTGAHTESDELPQQTTGTPGRRAALPDPRRGLSGGRRSGSGHPQESPWRNHELPVAESIIF